MEYHGQSFTILSLPLQMRVIILGHHPRRPSKAKSIGPYKENDYGEISSEWKIHQDVIREMCLSEEVSVSSSNNSILLPPSVATNRNNHLSVHMPSWSIG